MRSAAQMVSYELRWLCAGGGADGVGQPQPSDIVNAQGPRHIASMGLNFLSWNWLPLAPMAGVYSSRRRRDQRAPFDVFEGESEIVAGPHDRVLGHDLRAVLSRRVHEHDPHQRADGADVLRRLARRPSESVVTNWVPPFVWLFAKIFLVVSMFLWSGDFPRYAMTRSCAGLEDLIPLTLAWIAVIGLWCKLPGTSGNDRVLDFFKSFFIG